MSMPLLIVNVVDDFVTYNGVAYPIVIEDDMFTFRVISFTSENDAYGEHHGGFGEKVDPVQASAIFHRFKDIWDEENAKAQEAERIRQEHVGRANIEAEERRAAMLEQARAPRMVPPNKAMVMARMTDEELIGLDAMVAGNPVFRMLWKHTDVFQEPKQRIHDLLVTEGYSIQRAHELFADEQISPAGAVAPEGP